MITTYLTTSHISYNLYHQTLPHNPSSACGATVLTLCWLLRCLLCGLLITGVLFPRVASTRPTAFNRYHAVPLQRLCHPPNVARRVTHYCKRCHYGQKTCPSHLDSRFTLCTPPPTAPASVTTLRLRCPQLGLCPPAAGRTPSSTLPLACQCGVKDERTASM